MADAPTGGAEDGRLDQRGPPTSGLVTGQDEPVHALVVPLPGWQREKLTAEDAEALRLLRSSEHPLVHFFPHGVVFAFDHDLRYLSAGGPGLADLGLSREALEGQTIFEAFPQATSSVIEPLYRLALAGESSTFDVPYGDRVFTQRLAPVLSRSGGVLAGVGFVEDVTALRESERQSREAAQRFRLAFEHAPIGKALVDLDGGFLAVNPALCRLTGYASEQLRSLTFQDITHPDDLGADLTQLAQLTAGEIDRYSTEKRYLTATGNLVWVWVTVALVRADDGEPMYFIRQIQDITERKTREDAVAETKAQLEQVATHDPLTGLANRRLVEQSLSNLLDPSERRASHHGVAVLFCDLDGFKSVNDQHGHGAGDEVLREAAARLTACARPEDIVGRIGGDEFVVLIATRLEDDATAVVTKVAQRICDAIAAPFAGPSLSKAITISIGIALSERGAGAVGLLRDADAAMYLAKRAGKNGFVFGATPEARDDRK